MYEYKINVPFKIESCMNCPFRHENIQHEAMQSVDVLSGVIEILRRQSYCMIKNESIIISESVDGYNSRCPLKDKVTYLPDEK